MTKKTYTSPFLIQISSGSEGKHCDLYPHGSIHTVRKGDDGHLWVDGRIDIIRDQFDVEILEEKPEIKKCVSCFNDFPLEWPFLIDHDTKNSTCIRCFERKNILSIDRENYREAIRKEFLIEQNKK